jgi:hypothetical protein
MSLVATPPAVRDVGSGHGQRRRHPRPVCLASRWSKFMKKSILIALFVAANGLLVGCVGQGNLTSIAPPAPVNTAAAGH